MAAAGPDTPSLDEPKVESKTVLVEERIPPPFAADSAPPGLDVTVAESPVGQAPAAAVTEEPSATAPSVTTAVGSPQDAAPPPAESPADVVRAAEPPPVAGPISLAPMAAAVAAAVSGPQVVPPPADGIENLPQRPKILTIGDENLLFTSGLQDSYPDWEFTCSSVLSRQNLELYNFDPQPSQLKGRIRHMVDPHRTSKNFRQGEFEAVVLFLPGLGYQVPSELGTPDRPLFAYRTHLFTFHVLRQVKQVLKAEGAKLYLVWPDEMGLMSSPFGAAGIEMLQLMQLCGFAPSQERSAFEYGKVEDGWFMPFLFGEVPQETPEWLVNINIHSYSVSREPVPLPLSAALLVHPDIAFASIKDATPKISENSGPPPVLRHQLTHEANVRRERLKGIYGPDDGKAPADCIGVVPLDAGMLLSIPLEIFMISFDEIGHISLLLKYSVCDDQPQGSTSVLEVLDPRLPTRIARPPQPKIMSPLINAMNLLGKKRARQEDEWGGMPFYCSLTKICLPTVDKMRQHMNGELYKRMARNTPGWETSTGKQEILEMIAEADQMEEQQKRARHAMGQMGQHAAMNQRSGGNKGRGKDRDYRRGR